MRYAHDSDLIPQGMGWYTVELPPKIRTTLGTKAARRASGHYKKLRCFAYIV
jgi:hypothetical protein